MSLRLLRLRSLVGFCALRMAVPSGVARGQADTSLFVTLSGADTIAVERLVRMPAHLDAELVFRAAGARFTWSATLTPAGTISSMDNAYRAATADPASPPVQTATLRFVGDSVIVDIGSGASMRTQRIGSTAGALPYINPSFALVEQLIVRARAIGGDSVTVPVFAVSGGQTIPTSVVRVGGDSAVVTIAGSAVRLRVDGDGHIMGGSVPAQGLRIIRTRSAAPGAMRVEKPDYSAPAGAPYVAEDVTIPTPGGWTLAGTLTLPRGASASTPVAAIVTITGSGQEDRDEAIPIFRGYRPFRQVADTLGRRGVAVLRMDDRGYGASQGNAARATSADFADDIRAGLAYLRGRREIDPRRLGVLGHSEGGLIGPMVAASDTALRILVILAGPAYDGHRILEYQNKDQIDNDSTIAPAKRDSLYAVAAHQIDSLAAVQPWMKFFLGYDPLPTARRVRQPVLILQGATDKQVTPEQARLLADAIRAGGNKDVTVRVFANANHLFVEDASGLPSRYARLTDFNVRRDVLGTIADWVVARLR
jgi:uncharacterized protein